MKRLLSLIFAFLVSYQCFSQSLEGEWRGEYITMWADSKPAKLPPTPIPIGLKFILNRNSSYTVCSYSRGQNSAGQGIDIVCKVIYKILPKNALYLEEVEVLKPEDYSDNCFQKMYLTIRTQKKKVSLYGKWDANIKDCASSGKIHFDKIVSK